MLLALNEFELTALNITYDTALPQALYDDITRLTGKNPCGQIVMVYPSDASALPGLCPTSFDGVQILEQYIAKTAVREPEVA